jgi:aspartyl-tRNA(Asn)/glutamyl-tRNA(Gln) amidotransferase subunit C
MAASKVDLALVRHVAKLASLRLTDDETEKLASDLERIVAYVEQLNELDTSSVLPTAHVAIDRTPWRTDVPALGLSHEDALSEAPRATEDGFAVPTFVE